jgi:hypothetical protein
MAKRFSETKIWEDPWFQELSLEWRMVWFYLCAKCDEAGIWKINYPLAEFQLGFKPVWKDLEKYINNGKNRVHINGNVIVLLQFLEFQYGKAIFESKHGFHTKIRNMTQKYWDLYNKIPCGEGIQYPLGRTKEEEEEEEEEEVKVKVMPPNIDDIKAYCIERNNGIDWNKFHSFYEAKGWMIGKNKMKDWKAAVRTWEQKQEEQPKRRYL